jgi:hypothetical protein
LIHEPFQLILHDGTLRSLAALRPCLLVTAPVRVRSVCDTLPGICREWR